MALIEKEELLRIFQKECCGDCGCCLYFNTEIANCDLIANATEVNVEPALHGHWIVEFSKFDKKRKITSYGLACSRCSQCGEKTEMAVTKDHVMKKCPECGTIMDGQIEFTNGVANEFCT